MSKMMNMDDEVVAEVEDGSDAEEDEALSGEAAVKSMNELHVALARKAAELAMLVLETVDVSEIPVASAVSLLKFGVDLERKALLGSEDDVEKDPFASLAAAMDPKNQTQEG